MTPAPTPAEPGTRQRVLMVAARLFRTQGYAATPLRDIASAAGMKAGSLYNHFSSKEEIVVEILNLGVQTAYEKVRASVERLGDAPCRTVLRAAIFAHLTCLLGEDNFTSANIRIFAHVPPHVRDATMTLRHGYERYWLELLRRCAAEGALKPDIDLRMLSMFLFGAMNWALEWYRPGRHSIAQLADELVALYVPSDAAEPARRPKRRALRAAWAEGG